MEYKKILYEVRDGVAVITINSPKTLNAITDEIIEELYQAITAAEADDGVRVMVLTRRGQGILCRGRAGLFPGRAGERDPGYGGQHAQFLPAAGGHQDLRKAGPLPPCGVPPAGAGCSLALCCDFCFAADNAKSSKHLWVWGCCPTPGGLYAWPRRWATRAVQMCMTGEP